MTVKLHLGLGHAVVETGAGRRPGTQNISGTLNQSYSSCTESNESRCDMCRSCLCEGLAASFRVQLVAHEALATCPLQEAAVRLHFTLETDFASN